jgi:hypothetical protein
MKFILNEKGLVAAKRLTYINNFLCVRVVEFSIGFQNCSHSVVFFRYFCVFHFILKKQKWAAKFTTSQKFVD